MSSRSKAVTICLTLLISSVASAQSAAAPQLLGQEVCHKGPYSFVGCDGTQDPLLAAIFEHLGSILENSMLPQASASAPLFKDFFTSNSPTDVANVFKDINQGATTSSINNKALQKPDII